MGTELGHLLDSLGWAILHSFWQGALAAIAVFLFRSLTKDSQAALRYGFQILCLTLCLAAFMVTFSVYHLRTGAQTFAFSNGAASFSGLTALFADGQSLQKSLVLKSGSSIWPSIFAAYAPLLGFIWCLGFALMAVRYTGAYILTQRLRTLGITQVSSEWQRRFSTLVKNSGIRRDVEILISSRVASPVTLGFFKPIVLVPTSFFAGLPCAQVEAILLHEIAHIRRHDYLFNLLQTSIKTIFFFHPAIHYISRKIDNDREHACDDFAVSLTRDPQSLARGLAMLRMDIAKTRFALAADNGNTPLLSRLKRLGGTPDAQRRPEHVLTSALALVLVGGLYLSTSPLADAHPIHQPDDKNTHPSAKSSNYRFEKITLSGRSFTAKIAKDGSRWVNIDGRWFDADINPDVIAKLPETPAAPAPIFTRDGSRIENNTSGYDQYEVDLAYYIARLENDTEDAGSLKKIQKAKILQIKTQQDIKIATNSQTQDSEVTLAGAPKPPATPQPPQPLAPGVYMDGKHVEGSDIDALAEAFAQDMHKIETARANGEMSERAAEKARSHAETQFEKRIEKAAEQREKEWERAEAQREKAWEKDEAEREKAMERAEAHREQALKHAEISRNNALEHAEAGREHTRIAREHALADAEAAREQADAARDRAEAAREQADAAREQAREAREEARAVRTHKYGNFNKVMLKQLKADGLIAADAVSVTLTYPSKKMHVNGKDVADHIEDNYCAILDAYDIKKTNNTRIDISPKSFKYSSSSEHNSHSIEENFSTEKEASLSVLPEWKQWTTPAQPAIVPASFSEFSHPTPSSWVALDYSGIDDHGRPHSGIDLAAPMATPIRASAYGTVTSAKTEGNWGKQITIAHADGFETRYSHVGEICVAEGDTVNQGDYIAKVGTTGDTPAPHLHFEIRRNGLAQNPLDYIAGI